MVPARKKKEIRTRLLKWFYNNGRDLPWRKTRDPYAIWVSEVMLQQTQAMTVIPYYQKFLKAFPTVRHLARAELSNVLKIWEGMGYYSRARNLHRASRVVLERYGGIVPDNLKDLINLPGIGRSTAGAILSFAFQKDAPILDANVRRVISRLFAVSDRAIAGKTDALLWKISENLVPEGLSNPFNQALMDLGSMICKPKEPDCALCPLTGSCKARASGNPEKYPSKKIRNAVPHVEAFSAIIQRNGKVLVRQRPPSGLLGGLWEFPNWTTKEKQNSKMKLKLRNQIKKDMKVIVNTNELIGTFKHTFSHFKLTLHVFSCQHLGGKAKGKWISIRNLHLFPMSRIHRRIAEKIDEETRG